MIVISKIETKRVLKGVKYEVEDLWNSGNSSKWINGKLKIKGINYLFLVSNFTDLNGDPLPKIDITSQKVKTKRLDFDTIKNGDILVCTANNLKTIIGGCFYIVEDKKTIKRVYSAFSHNIEDKYIKLTGINRWFKYSQFNFRQPTQMELRDISLSKVLGENSEKILTKTIRKIDTVGNKNLELIKILSSAVIDPNRHHLGIIEWTVKKSGNLMGIKESDYSDLLDLKLSDIIKIIDSDKNNRI
jgi:hypothetical protein